MHDEDAHHPNKSLQDKLEHIYTLRRAGRVNFEDNSHYIELLNRLGNPHLNLPPIIHLAGTNGKGSTLAMLRSILEAEGYRVHAYTSPHLHVFNERIYLGGQDISDDMLEQYLDHLFELNANNPVTFFEFTTALAFYAFTQNPADIVLLETGMGGRLDCTNVIKDPIATVITPISYDHMEFLGDTLLKIAGEKAGILKQSVPCILAPQNPEVIKVFEDKSAMLNCPLSIGQKDWQCNREGNHMAFQLTGSPTHQYPLPSLLGAHQIQNAGAALMTLESIKDVFPVSEDAKATGLQNIHWPGRMERKTGTAYNALLPKDWEIWFDGGHNIAGAKAIASILKYWEKSDPKPLHIFLGMKEGKDVDGVKSILTPYATTLTNIQIGENLTPHFKALQSNTDNYARILVCGSLYNYF